MGAERSGWARRGCLAVLASALLVTGPAWGDGGPVGPMKSESTGLRAPEGRDGIATYYAKRYEGRRTASGDRHRSEKLTAAHPEIPLGTRVRVVHAGTGKEVIVRVNDRCRKKKVPVIDLSRAAARELGILGKGKARVRIISLSQKEDTSFVTEIDTP